MSEFERQDRQLETMLRINNRRRRRLDEITAQNHARFCSELQAVRDRRKAKRVKALALATFYASAVAVCVGALQIAAGNLSGILVGAAGFAGNAGSVILWEVSQCRK